MALLAEPNTPAGQGMQLDEPVEFEKNVAGHTVHVAAADEVWLAGPKEPAAQGFPVHEAAPGELE